jgi:hypothetical protein
MHARHTFARLSYTVLTSLFVDTVLVSVLRTSANILGPSIGTYNATCNPPTLFAH